MLLAWMFYEGAGHALPQLVILLTLEALIRVIREPSRVPKIAVAGAIVGLVGFALAASRLLPVLDQYRQHSRHLPKDMDHMDFAMLKDVFLARSHEFVLMNHWRWPEYGSYLGPILITLAFVGMLLGGLESGWMVVLCLLLLSVMAGAFAPWAPWPILNAHVPPFKEMRVPSRWVSGVAMFVSVFAGLGVQRISDKARAWLPRNLASGVQSAVVGVALVGAGDVVSMCINTVEAHFTSAPEQKVAPSARLYYYGDGLAALIDQPRQNRGRVECFDEWGFNHAAMVWHGDVPQARALDDRTTVEVANRTQNTITVDVVVQDYVDAPLAPDASEADRMAVMKARPTILLNTVYDDDWTTDVGVPLNLGRTLGIALPPGRHRVHARCWPRTFNAGVALTLLGILGTTVFFVRSRRKRSA